MPVLTIGPHVRKSKAASGAFHSVLFATDFSEPCEAAAPFAVSLAEENDAQLILLYVAPKPGGNEQGELAIADVMQRLGDLVPSDARRWCRPSPIVQYGDAADRILEVAIERGADLIVLGVRDAGGHLGAAKRPWTAKPGIAASGSHLSGSRPVPDLRDSTVVWWTRRRISHGSTMRAAIEGVKRFGPVPES